MNDRDHFAAAALTGLLASDQYDRLVTAADYADTAYEIADTMLRERERTNHDAAPEATAGTPGTGDTPKPINDCVSDRSKPITGPDPDSRVWETPVHTPAPHATPGEGSVPREGTQEPVAWGVVYPNGMIGVLAFYRRDAEERATASDRVVPLYRHPPCQDFSQKNLTLTGAEREAVERAIDALHGVEDMSAGACKKDDAAAATLRGLLERLG